MHSPLKISKRVLIGVGLFSMVANMLMLTGPLFMLQVYDRVLASQSVPTLMALGMLVAVLFVFYGVLDFVRGQIMAHMGYVLDYQVSGEAFYRFSLSPLRGNNKLGYDPLRDMKQVRRFLSGPGAVILFDLPWFPIYLGVIFLLHPMLGWFGALGALLLIVSAVLNEVLSKKHLQKAMQMDFEESSLAQSARRNSETVYALGMINTLRDKWLLRHWQAVDLTGQASKVSSAFGSISKTLRLAIQSFILGLGAYLAIAQEITPGAMIAASIIFSRALAPAEQIIAQWRSIAEARFSWRRLHEEFKPQEDGRDYSGILPAPKETLAVNNLTIAAPGTRTILLKGVSFLAVAGDGIGILGASGSGKSSLAKAIVGAWLPLNGTIRLDKATLDQWPPEILGQHVGYMPQDIELFDGTIAENISRFRAIVSFADVLEAGQSSGAHSMILQFPEGYETNIGVGGIQLSAGQRQRVALARALFGSPFLIVLDEPNSNLDREGEMALAKAILEIKKKGSIVIVVAHRSSIISQLDKLLVLEAGRPQVYGPKEKVREHMQQQNSRKTNKELKVAT